MADTERTLSDLLTNLFQDGQAENSITEQDMRDLIVSATSEKILKTASTPIFEDLQVGSNAIGKGGSAPTLTNYRDNIDMFAFAPSTMNEGFFDLHVPHNMKQGTTPTFHIHWTHNDAAPSGNVLWKVEYTIAKGYDVSTFAASTTLSTTSAAGAQYAHTITDDDDMPLASITEIEPDSILLARVYRDATDAADTFSSDAFMLHVDLHYEVGQVATEERNRPFTSAGW